MPDSVAAAWIAAGASISAAILTASVAYVSSRRAMDGQRRLAAQQAVAQQELEQLKATLTMASAEKSARQSYEYEARKKLYVEAEPLLFQFYENASYAINRIANLARAAREGKLPFWLDGHDEYYFRSTLHSFLVPLASIHILRERLTALDLTLDRRIERQYEISKAINRAFNRDYFFAEAHPRLPYEPVPGQFGGASDTAQGVVGGEIQRAISAVVKVEDEKFSIKKFWEFSDDLDSPESLTRRQIVTFPEVWKNFSPISRPVLWRIVIAQLFLYRAARLHRIEPNVQLRTQDILNRVVLTAEERDQFAFSNDPAQTKEVGAAFEIGMRYLEDVMRAIEALDPSLRSTTS